MQLQTKERGTWEEKQKDMWKEREGEYGRSKERQTDRQTERQRQTDIDREKERKREKERESDVLCVRRKKTMRIRDIIRGLEYRVTRKTERCALAILCCSHCCH